MSKHKSLWASLKRFDPNLVPPDWTEEAPPTEELSGEAAAFSEKLDRYIATLLDNWEHEFPAWRELALVGLLESALLGLRTEVEAGKVGESRPSLSAYFRYDVGFDWESGTLTYEVFRPGDFENEEELEAKSFSVLDKHSCHLVLSSLLGESGVVNVGDRQLINTTEESSGWLDLYATSDESLRDRQLQYLLRPVTFETNMFSIRFHPLVTDLDERSAYYPVEVELYWPDSAAVSTPFSEWADETVETWAAFWSDLIDQISKLEHDLAEPRQEPNARLADLSFEERKEFYERHCDLTGTGRLVLEVAFHPEVDRKRFENELEIRAHELIATALGKSLPSAVPSGKEDAAPQDDQADSLPSGTPEASLSDDMRTLCWKGQEYRLSTQRSRAIEFLLNAHRAGKLPLHQDHVLAEIESTSRRMLDLFRGSPLWKSFVLVERGFVRLNLEDQAEE